MRIYQTHDVRTTRAIDAMANLPNDQAPPTQKRSYSQVGIMHISGTAKCALQTLKAMAHCQISKISQIGVIAAKRVVYTHILNTAMYTSKA